MHLDQIHEQNNKLIKRCGGASDLLNKVDDSALIRWETCSPDIARDFSRHFFVSVYQPKYSIKD